MTNLEISHVQRPALPWREATLTECGLPVEKHRTISVEEFVAKVKTEGKTRAAYTTCVTCFQTLDRWESPWRVKAGRLSTMLERELQRHRDPDKERLERELQVIAHLIAAHRDEFEEGLAALGASINLDDLRSNRKARQKYTQSSRPDNHPRPL